MLEKSCNPRAPEIFPKVSRRKGKVCSSGSAESLKGLDEPQAHTHRERWHKKSECLRRIALLKNKPRHPSLEKVSTLCWGSQVDSQGNLGDRFISQSLAAKLPFRFPCPPTCRDSPRPVRKTGKTHSAPSSRFAKQQESGTASNIQSTGGIRLTHTNGRRDDRACKAILIERFRSQQSSKKTPQQAQRP